MREGIKGLTMIGCGMWRSLSPVPFFCVVCGRMLVLFGVNNITVDIGVKFVTFFRQNISFRPLLYLH